MADALVSAESASDQKRTVSICEIIMYCAPQNLLPGFWHEDLDAKLTEAASRDGKRIERVGEEAAIFSGFDRVQAYRVLAVNRKMA